LIKILRDPEEAAGYLNVALEEGDKALFLLALRNVIEAQGNLTKVAKLARLNRVSLYKMLSQNGNPGFANILALLKIAGIRFQMTTLSKVSKRAPLRKTLERQPLRKKCS
jgi:probable addiction module antidote protein